MSFKSLCSGLVLTSLLVTVGCSDFLRDKRSAKSIADEKTIKFDINEECLKQVPKGLQQFFADEESTKTLDPSVDCLKDSLDKFQKYARGEQKDVYTAKELQHFLNRYLLKSNQISDAFLSEVMKLKVVVVGGDRSSLTRKEFQDIYAYLDLLKIQAKSLSGSFKLLLFNKDKKQAETPELQKTLGTSEEKVLNVLTKLLDQSQIVGSRYEFDDLKGFIFELDKFVGDSEALKAIIKWLPVVETAKLLFIGEHSKLVSQKEWKNALSWLNKGYFFALKYYYIIETLNLTTPSEWAILLPWTDQALDLIESSPMMREKSILQAQYLDRLIDGIWGLNLFDISMDSGIIKRVYRKAIVHMIEGQPAGKGNPNGVTGLKLEHFNIIRQEYHIWRLSQMSVNEAFTNNQALNQTGLIQELGKFDFNRAIKEIGADGIEKETLVRAWFDWLTALKQDRPVVLNKKKKVTVAYNLKGAQVHFSSLNLMNAVRSWTRLAMRGYGDHRSPHLGDSRISEQRLINLEEDFREFGRAIGFLDPRQPSPAARTFKEGNFFTFHGNGDDWLSYLETFELLNVLMSGGRNIVGEILDDLGKKGCLLPVKDIFNKPIAVEWCFKQSLKKQASVYFDNMTWMNQLISGFSLNEYDDFYEALMKLSRLPETDPSKVEYAEIRTAATVLQYVESLFVVYDKNGDQILSEEEVTQAFPRFKNFIIKMAKNDWFTEDIFLFLIYEGRAPTGVGEILSFKAERLAGLGDVNKLQLIKVLSVLKDAPQVQ